MKGVSNEEQGHEHHPQVRGRRRCLRAPRWHDSGYRLGLRGVRRELERGHEGLRRGRYRADGGHARRGRQQGRAGFLPRLPLRRVQGHHRVCQLRHLAQTKAPQGAFSLPREISNICSTKAVKIYTALVKFCFSGSLFSN